MKLWARRESLELNENIGSLLYTILKNHVLNEIRHNAIVVEGNWEMMNLSCRKMGYMGYNYNIGNNTHI